MGAWQERRSFFRVEGRVYLNYRKVAEEEKEDLLNEMHAQEIVFAGGSREAGGQDIEDPVLQCLDIRLQRIEEKLDLLLGRSDYRRGVEKKDLSLTPCVVSISGSGIRFPTRERFKAGDLLEVMVMLPIMPDHFIRLLGEVVHTLKRICFRSGRGPGAHRPVYLSAPDAGDSRQAMRQPVFPEQGCRVVATTAPERCSSHYAVS
jgi:hypothetical protein